MSRQNVVAPVLFFILSFGLTLTVLAAVRFGQPESVEASNAEAAAPVLDPGDYAAAAASFQAGDLSAAQADLLARESTDSLEATVILGLYSHASQQHAAALEHLRAAERYRGELADWRLWALAESAEALGQIPLSTAALERIVAEHPESPLVSRAVWMLSRQATKRSDWPGVLDIARNSEELSLESQTREHLARLAWEAAAALDDPDLERSLARRLLVEHPLIAAELQVVDLFRQPDGLVPWTDFLSADELVRRGRRLLETDLADSALETLAAVDAHDRDRAWTLLQAESLIAAARGADALDLLDPIVGSSDSERAELEWWRAQAALEAATPRRGRRHLTADERHVIRERAKEHLRLSADLGDTATAVQSLRTLFRQVIEEEQIEEALSILARLRVLDPENTIGARPLWQLGWKAFSERNYSGAVGLWTELGSFYTQSNYNRGALYWSARSHENLGNEPRAQELFRQVVSVDVDDFYSTLARNRLRSEPEPEPVDLAPTEPWPTDIRLARADNFFQLGLHEAALVEVDSWSDSVDHRAAHALRARILAAKGERRQSIISLRLAFPLLGTPHQSMVPLEARQLYYPLDFRELIEEHSRSRRLPSHLVFGMIRQESAFDTGATSWAGARGLMQIMPATGRELARRLGLRYSHERLSDPEFSIQLGTSYLQQLMSMFQGDEVLALAGYNAGPYRIKRLWRQAGKAAEIDHFVEQLSLEETRNYVKRVLLYSDSYRRLYDSAS